jgi:predicted nuclease with TOPRIM domain
MSIEQVVVLQRELQSLRAHSNLLEERKGKLDVEVSDLKKSVHDLESAIAAGDQARVTQKNEDAVVIQNLQANTTKLNASLLTAANEQAQLQLQLDLVRSIHTCAFGYIVHMLMETACSGCM